MGSPLGTALFEALGGGNNYKNQLAGALAAGRLGSMKSTARYNTLRGDEQESANKGMEDLLALHPLDPKDPFSETLRNTNPHAAAGANAKRALANIGNDSLNAKALSGANNALAGSRNANANQTNFHTDTAKTGFESLLNDPNMSDTLKSFIQINATNQTGGGLVALLNSPDVQAHLKAKVKTEGSKQEVNKAKVGTEGSKQDLNVKKGNVQDSIKDVNEEKVRKLEIEIDHEEEEINLTLSEIEQMDAKTGSIEATLRKTNKKLDAQIEKINSRTDLNKEMKKVYTEGIKKVQSATALLDAKAKALFKGNALSQNQFLKSATTIYKQLAKEDPAVGQNPDGTNMLFSELPADQQIAYAAKQTNNFQAALAPQPTVSGALGGVDTVPSVSPIADVPTNPVALGLGGGTGVSTPQSTMKLNSAQTNALANMQSGQLSQLRAEALAAGNADLVNMIDQQLGK